MRYRMVTVIASLTVASCTTTPSPKVAAESAWWDLACEAALEELTVGAGAMGTPDASARASVAAAYPTTTKEMAENRRAEYDEARGNGPPGNFRDQDVERWEAEDREVALCYLDGNWNDHVKMPLSVREKPQPPGRFTRYKALVDRETGARQMLGIGNPENMPLEGP